jgi:hypothetical protein
MEWTHEPPKEPGFYFWKNPTFDNPKERVMRLVNAPSGWLCELKLNGELASIEDYKHLLWWPERIQEPPSPTSLQEEPKE